MNNKTWSCKPIQTWSSLYELRKINYDFYKVYMVTYQIGHRVKSGVHIGEGSFFQADQIVPSTEFI